MAGDELLSSRVNHNNHGHRYEMIRSQAPQPYPSTADSSSPTAVRPSSACGGGRAVESTWPGTNPPASSCTTSRLPVRHGRFSDVCATTPTCSSCCYYAASAGRASSPAPFSRAAPLAGSPAGSLAAQVLLSGRVAATSRLSFSLSSRPHHPISRPCRCCCWRLTVPRPPPVAQ